MSNNKREKLKLIELYGAECFIDKLHLRFDPKRRYSSEKKMKKMEKLTFHHIIEKYKRRRN